MTEDEINALDIWSKWDKCLPPYWGELRLYIFRRDHYTCTRCRKRFGQKKLDAHHIIPKEESGSDNPRNLVTMCEPCHDELHDHQLQRESDNTQPELIGVSKPPDLKEDEMVLIGELMPGVPIYKARKLINRKIRKTVSHHFKERRD